MASEERVGQKRKIDKIFWITVVVCLFAALVFCTRKQGLHEDEYYSYYSTSRSVGLYIEPNAWKDADSIRNEFEVVPGEGFRYGLVKEVQSWDVHPPVYYWVLHTVCSCFPGTFSKWSGLAVNLVFYFGCLLLLWRLTVFFWPEAAWNLEKDGKKSRAEYMLRLLVLVLWGISPAAISSVLFIRMYVMLTFFLLWTTILHLKHLDDEVLMRPGFLIPLMLSTYLGFLTQYYFGIYLFFLAAAFCIWRLIRDRKIRNALLYGITLVITLILSVITYPSAPGQMFHGQRGAQATGSFFDLSNTWDRIMYFAKLLDSFVFGEVAGILLLIAIWLWVRKASKESAAQKRRAGSADDVPHGVSLREWVCDHSDRCLLWFACIGYFLTVSKTALLLGDSSIRYILPIAPVLWTLVGAGLWRMAQEDEAKSDSGSAGEKRIDRIKKTAVFSGMVLALLVNVIGLFFGKVLFLYPEAADRVAFSKAHANAPVIYLYDQGQSWCVWSSTSELLCYPKVYFADVWEKETITDESIRSATELVVYLFRTDQDETALERITESAPGVSEYEMEYRDTFCDIYYFH